MGWCRVSSIELGWDGIGLNLVLLANRHNSQRIIDWLKGGFRTEVGLKWFLLPSLRCQIPFGKPTWKWKTQHIKLVYLFKMVIVNFQISEMSQLCAVDGLKSGWINCSNWQVTTITCWSDGFQSHPPTMAYSIQGLYHLAPGLAFSWHTLFRGGLRIRG